MHDRGEESKLRQLLEVEDRLEALVRTAMEDGRRRVADAVALRDARLADARVEAEREDAAAASADAAAHTAELAAIANAADATVRACQSVPADRIDGLARWALEQAISGGGERQ